ncbi:galectin-2-like isoform X1 [Eleginops maclovinus]
MTMQLEMKNLSLTAGDRLKVKGIIQHDAERFKIELGSGTDDIALHFNPRFDDDADGSVLVFNSKTAGSWGNEIRDTHNPLHRGGEVKLGLMLAGDVFEVELPDGQQVQFPNRENVDVINYVRIAGDFKLTSFKIC